MFTEPREIRLTRTTAARCATPTSARDEAFADADESEAPTARVSTDLALAAGLRDQLASLEAQRRELSRLLAALEG